MVRNMYDFNVFKNMNVKLILMCICWSKL